MLANIFGKSLLHCEYPQETEEVAIMCFEMELILDPSEKQNAICA